MYAIPKHLRKELKERLQLRHNMALPNQSKWATLFKLLRTDAHSDTDESDSISDTGESDYTPSYRYRALNQHTRTIRRPDEDSTPLELSLAGNAQPVTNGIPCCQFCKRRGHDEDSCRRKHSLCFSCGADSHKLEQCPTRRRKSKLPAPSRRTSSNNRNCVVCGIPGHIRYYCPQLRSSNESYTPAPPAAAPYGQPTGPTAPYVTTDLLQHTLQQFAESIRAQIASLAPMLNSDAPRN